MRTQIRFNKLTAWLLTLAMLMTFIPSFTLAVSAEETTTYTVSIEDITGGTITADKTTDLKAGDTVTLTVTPDEGYHLKSIIINDETDETVIGKTEVSFTMPEEDVTINAKFAEGFVIYFDNTASDWTNVLCYKGDGYTYYVNLGSGIYAFSVKAEIVYFTNYQAGMPNSAFPEGYFITKAITPEAGKTYTYTGYDVTVADAAGGTVAVKSNDFSITKASEGQTVTLTVTPNEEYSIDTVKYNDTEITAVEGVYSFEMPAEDVTVTATFKAAASTTYTVTFDANGGSVTPTSAETVDGKLTEFPAPIREGYVFNGWFDAAEGGNAVTLDTLFTANTTIYAKWTVKKYEIYVGGVQVTAENATDVLGDGTVSYNATTNTLTLDNANLTSGITYNKNLAIATIFATDDLNIEPKGTNQITTPDMTGFSTGIAVGGDLTIFGSGSLTIMSGNVTGVAETGGEGNFASNGIVVRGLLTIRTAEVNAVGSTVSVTGDTTVESSDSICQAFSNGILSYGLVLEDGAKLNATGGSVSIDTANIDAAGSWGVYVFYGDTIIYDAVLNAVGGKVIGGENASSYGICTIFADMKICDADAKVTLTAGDAEATVETNSNGIVVLGDLDIQSGEISVTSGKRNEDTSGDNCAVCVQWYTDANNVLQGGNISLADAMTISSPENGTVKEIDDTYSAVVDGSDNIATNVKIEVRKNNYSGGLSNITTTTTTNNDDGSTTKTTTNKITGTVTEVTTGADGSITTVVTKKDGSVTTTEKNKDGSEKTVEKEADGTTTTTEKDTKGNTTETVEIPDGDVTTTTKDTDGNTTVVTKKNDGTTTTEETLSDGTTIKTETTAAGKTTAEVEAKGETEVVIPVENAEDVYEIVVTDENGNETVITDFETVDRGIAITVDGNVSVLVSKGNKKEFADVHPVEHWSGEYVDYVYVRGLMMGTSETHFSPDATLTRAMLVTVLYRAEGEPEMRDAQWFEDVAKGQWYSNAVAWATFNGITVGYGDGNFGPDDYITREQIAAIMHRYADFKGYDVSVGENTNILSYTDAHNVSEYAIGSMQYAVGSGLIKGKTETTLNPKDNATRAEAAAILERFIKLNK